VQREPAAFWSHFRLGHVQARAGEQQQAWQEFNVCVALKPDLAECWYNRALAATATRKHREALADYAQTIALRPAFADAWLNRGLMLIELDRAADALTDLDKALELGADPFSAHLGLAVAQGRVGNLEEAQASCKRALIVKPDDPKAKALLQTLNSAVSKRR
jgi:tetratricopeptide (TPR) repeat protein